MPLAGRPNGEAPGEQSLGAKPQDDGVLYRCEHCDFLVTMAHIQQGGCSMCGGRRLKIAVLVKDEEVEWLKERGYSLTPERWREQPATIKE